MPTSQFENIRVLLAEPSSSLRGKLKALLRERGAKHIFDTGNLGDAIDIVRTERIDLLIGDTKMPEGDLSQLIYQIRHGEIGENPFIVTITLLSNSDEALVQKVIDSGTDHVMLKPFDVAEVIGCIESLTHARKKFVVTTDYIGPNRRTSPHPGTMSIPLIDIPNPLRSQMTGQMTKPALKRSINSAMETINDQKVVRHTYQVGWLMAEIMKVDSGETLDSGDATISGHLDRLRAVSKDLTKRIKKTRYAHVTDLCMTLSNTAESLAKNNFNQLDIELLIKLTRVIQGTIDDTQTAPGSRRRNPLADPETQEKKPARQRNSLLKSSFHK